MDDSHLFPTFRYTTSYSRGLGIAGTMLLLNLAWNPIVTKTKKKSINNSNKFNNLLPIN